MIFIAIFLVLFLFLYLLRFIPFFKKNMAFGGALAGMLLFGLIYLMGINQSSGSHILFFNFMTLLIPVNIASWIDPTGDLDVPFILVGAFIEFIIVGYLVGSVWPKRTL